MRIQTFSIVVGTEACNARCPFCISKQTTDAGVPGNMALQERQRIDRNFKKSCRLAQLCGCVTTLLTGKGEPTLFPDEILGYLTLMEKYDFPRIELQTNGIRLANRSLDTQLEWWYDRGLTTIALSMIHWNDEINKSVYGSERKYNLADLTKLLHEMGFFVRWSVTMLDGYIHNSDTALEMIREAKRNKVEQLTLRQAMATETTRNAQVIEWVRKHALVNTEVDGIVNFLGHQGTKLMTLPHGAMVYDFEGQNVCLTDCMTANPDGDDIRTLIFFPDGQTRYDWRYEGATL